jgi:hypothetical protein
MNRPSHVMLAAAGAVLMLAGAAAADQAKPPTPPAPAAPVPAQPTAPAKFVAPVRGQAEIGYMKPVTKAGAKEIVTTIQVKNMSAAPIAGLKVDEFWYDKEGNPVTGDTFRYKKLFMPGEVLTVTLTTPRNPKMDRNSYNFSHANGTIKTKLLPKL